MEGVFRRRVLLNFRADLNAVAPLLPAPLEPLLYEGFAIVGVCLIGMRNDAPKAFPAGKDVRRKTWPTGPRHRGFEVLLAADGRQGVDLARQERPDLVLMDLSLPEMDGWQATRILKGDAATYGIPVVALTAHAVAGDRRGRWRRSATTMPPNPSTCPCSSTTISRLVRAG